MRATLTQIELAFSPKEVGRLTQKIRKTPFAPIAAPTYATQGKQ